MNRAVPTSRIPSGHRARCVVGQLALAWTLAIPAGTALGQGMAPAPVPAASAVAAKPAKPAKLAAPRVDSAPAWNTLSASQQTALRPLAPIWHEINPNRKRKWIALSANFGKLSSAEQATLHGRMTEWATLSNADRNRARLSFAETRSLSSQEKKAQWDAYQALTPSQKQHLARQAAKSPPIGAAPAVTARTRGKLASVPVTRSDKGTSSTQATAVHAMPPASAASASTPPRQ